LSDEDKEIERDAFKELTPLMRKERVKGMRADMIAAQDEKLSKFMQEPVQRKADMEAINRKAESDLNLISKQLSNKSYHGWNIPEKEMEDTATALKTGEIAFFNADGSPNVKVMVEAALWLKNKDKIIKAAIEKGKVKGTRQVTKKLALPKRGSGLTTRKLQTQGDLDEAYQREKEKRRKKMKGNLV
jgi:hypothetical protein